MSSLTPASRNAEASQEAMTEGLTNGFLTLVSTSSAVYLAYKNSAAFAKRTNVQSRTALAIMPALFVFGITAETHLSRKMHQIAEEVQHSERTVEWAEQRAAAAQATQATPHRNLATHEAHLSDLYRQSIESSGVRIVPGDTLGYHHRAANFLAANPIKALAGVAIPSIAYIFYGRSGKEHLDFSVKLLHTRVFGQFATISLLLSVMGFKEFMDRNGRFLSQADADARVEDMQRVRAALMARLDEEQRHEQALKAELAAAHEQDIQDGNQHVATTTTVKKGKKKQVKKTAAAAPLSDDDSASTTATAIHATSSRSE